MPRDKTANHIKLMAAARQEFLERGFEKASMRSIGERCGLTAAGIYRHCRDKADLFDQLARPYAERIDDWLTAYTTALFEPVIHNYSQEEALRCLETVEAFFLPGWKNLMGF